MTRIAGVFNTRVQAENAISALTNAGFEVDDIGLLVSDRARDAIFPAAANNNIADESATRGGAAGALWGGALGVLIGGLTAIGTIVIPGSGLLAAGPLVAALAGAGTGAAAGGLVGALIGLGFSEDEARRYEREIEAGKAVLVVHTTDDRAHIARRILNVMDARVEAA